jgi:rubrerythrin
MTAAETRRQGVTADELANTRAVLAAAKVPGPRNPKPVDEGQPARYSCLRCGHRWNGIFQVAERTCPQCRSNSVRWLRAVASS